MPDGVQRYARTYNNPASLAIASSFGNFVTLKDGECLFAPSVSFFRALLPDQP